MKPWRHLGAVASGASPVRQRYLGVVVVVGLVECFSGEQLVEAFGFAYPLRSWTAGAVAVNKCLTERINLCK